MWKLLFRLDSNVASPNPHRRLIGLLRVTLPQPVVLHNKNGWGDVGKPATTKVHVPKVKLIEAFTISQEAEII
jgi:hypothetical protein